MRVVGGLAPVIEPGGRDGVERGVRERANQNGGSQEEGARLHATQTPAKIPPVPSDPTDTRCYPPLSFLNTQPSEERKR